MQSMTRMIGLLLIVVGIVALAYQGFTYTKHEQVAQIGNVEVSADTQKTVYFSPAWGVLALVAGIVLVVIDRRKKG